MDGWVGRWMDGWVDVTSLASALTANVTGEAKRGRSRSPGENTSTQPGRHAQQDQSQLSRSTQLERILPISRVPHTKHALQGAKHWPAHGDVLDRPGPSSATILAGMGGRPQPHPSLAPAPSVPS